MQCWQHASLTTDTRAHAHGEMRAASIIYWLVCLVVPAGDDGGAAAAASTADQEADAELDASAKEHLQRAKEKNTHAQYETHIRRFKRYVAK
jgi:hypothetical protein